MVDANELLKQMNEAGFKESAIEDTTSEFKPLNGEYIAVVHKVERKTGPKKDGSGEYDFISISAQVEETLGGDKGDGRYIDGLTFHLTTDFGLPNFCNVAFTAGVELDKSSIDSLLESAQALVGKTINVRAWEKDTYQRAKIVKEFKTTKKAASTATASSF